MSELRKDYTDNSIYKQNIRAHIKNVKTLLSFVASLSLFFIMPAHNFAGFFGRSHYK